MKESFNFNELPEANKRYILEECLGTGVYGKVFKAKDTQADGKNVAIKIQPINDDTNSYNQEEYRILRDFSNHPNLPEFYGIFKSVNDDCNEIWLVLEVRLIFFINYLICIFIILKYTMSHKLGR